LLKLLETEKWYYPLLSNNGKFLLELVLRKNNRGVVPPPCSERTVRWSKKGKFILKLEMVWSAANHI